MKMHSPNLAVTSVSYDGETFDADERGVFDVPEKAAAELQAHGLIPGEPKPVTPQAPAAPSASPAPGVPPTGNPAQWKAETLEAEAKRLEINPTLPRPELVKAVATARRAEAEKAAAEAEGQGQDSQGGTGPEGQE